MLFGTILHIGQSFIGVLLHAIRKVTTAYFLAQCARQKQSVIWHYFAHPEKLHSTLLFSAMHKVKAKLHTSKILHPTQSYMVEIFCPIHRDTYMCYFVPHAKSHNNYTNKFNSVTKLTNAKFYGCAILRNAQSYRRIFFRALRKVTAIRYLALFCTLGKVT